MQADFQRKVFFYVKICDPVMGDNGKMYVPDEILPVYRDVVVPLADILTPNQFEAEQITGLKVIEMKDVAPVIQALHKRVVKTVVLSSTDLGNDKHMVGIEVRRVDANFTDTGDLFAALFLAWSHNTNDNIKLTLENTIATMQAIVKDTYQKARAVHPNGTLPPHLIELRLVQNKATIENPTVTISAVELKL